MEEGSKNFLCSISVDFCNGYANGPISIIILWVIGGLSFFLYSLIFKNKK